MNDLLNIRKRMYRKLCCWVVDEDGHVYPRVSKIMFGLSKFFFIIEIYKQAE